MDNRTKGIAFEQYVRQILENAGIQTQSTIASNDYGADILFYYLGYYFVVQCKCLSGAAGIKPVQEVIGAISYYHAHYGIVVTNTFFTQQASNLAHSTGVLLVDNYGLSSIKTLIDHFFFSTPASPSQETPIEDWTIKDLMGRYNVGSAKIYSTFISCGLPYYKVGREYRFVPADVWEWERVQKEIPFGHNDSILLPGYLDYTEQLRKAYKKACSKKDRKKKKEIRRIAKNEGIALFPHRKTILLTGICLMVFGVFLLFYLHYPNSFFALLSQPFSVLKNFFNLS